MCVYDVAYHVTINNKKSNKEIEKKNLINLSEQNSTTRKSMFILTLFEPQCDEKEGGKTRNR